MPFLSIPLSGLTSLFTQKGTSVSSSYGTSGTTTSTAGGLSNLFNIDSSSLITAGILIVGAIFLLPQVIYWLTGVNLSAFSWARSKSD